MSKIYKMNKNLACSGTTRRLFCSWKSRVSERVNQMTNLYSPGIYIIPQGDRQNE